MKSAFKNCILYLLGLPLSNIYNRQWPLWQAPVAREKCIPWPVDQELPFDYFGCWYISAVTVWMEVKDLSINTVERLYKLLWTCDKCDTNREHKPCLQGSSCTFWSILVASFHGNWWVYHVKYGGQFLHAWCHVRNLGSAYCSHNLWTQYELSSCIFGLSCWFEVFLNATR